ncbi:MAG: hypothetical protein ACPGF6_00105 [Porticoccaceae bacterium]
MRIKRAESNSQSLSAELHSNLAPLLFERIQVDKQLVVLDVGLAMPATVDLFSNFKCKLIFVDLFSQELLSGSCQLETEHQQEHPQPTHNQLVEQFTAALNLDPKTKIDICLFWDFFNYLDGALVKAFIEALYPYVGENSCGYGLGVLNARRQLPNLQYGIRQLNILSQSQRTGEQRPVYPHSQRDLNNLLGYFDIDKSRLMPDGRVEYLLSQDCDSKFGEKSVI